jgi:hypothetical protein
MQTLNMDPASLRRRGASPNASKASPASVSRQIQLLFSAYRRDDFADPEGFVAQLGIILSEFPEEVVVYVTSPLTGLQRRSKWPPSISEVVEACEAHLDHLKRVRRPWTATLRIAPPAPSHAPGSLANVFVPATHARYGRLVEWAATADPRFFRFEEGRPGVWVAYDVCVDGKERA